MKIREVIRQKYPIKFNNQERVIKISDYEMLVDSTIWPIFGFPRMSVRTKGKLVASRTQVLLGGGNLGRM